MVAEPGDLQDRHDLLAALQRLLADTGAGERRIVAIVGAPGSGKSTLTDWLVEQLSGSSTQMTGGAVAVMGMDGFHFDDVVLADNGWEHQKGAPHTFDIGGLAATLRRIVRNDEPLVAVPVFDRVSELSRAAAAVIEKSVRLVIVEGNYLLCDQPGWSDLRQFFDLSVMLTVDEVVLHDRLVERWNTNGHAPAEAAQKANENDLPNARYVDAHSVASDWRFNAVG